MTINELQNSLIKEIERITQDMELINRKGEHAALKGYQHAIPFLSVIPDGEDSEGGLLLEDSSENALLLEGDVSKDGEAAEDELDLFPYFITRVDAADYKDDGGQAKVLLLFAVYDDDPDMRGYYSLTAVMERVIARFRQENVLGAFWCERKISMAFQDDDTYPQFFGAMEMIWHLPDISMEPLPEEFWNE